MKRLNEMCQKNGTDIDIGGVVLPKKLPHELKDFYFPFNWDLEKLWALPISSENHLVANLAWHMDIPIWSSQKGCMLFDLRPRTVLDNPEIYARHMLRLDKADLTFPIDAMKSGGRLVIIDGVHRLAKAVKYCYNTVRLRTIPREFIPQFAEEA